MRTGRKRNHHLTRSRNQALALFGQKPMFPSEEFDTYDDNGGKPFRPETAIALDELKRRSGHCRSRW
jgi:hypothetical protein